MKILVVKFRTNDLDPSYGKQVEFSSKNVQEFFEFKNTEEHITFVYNDYNFKPSLDKKNIKGYLKLSPARGDYKVYQNLDESLFIKDFFIHELGLSLTANKDDFFTLAKNSNTEYFLSYIPNNSDLGKFISKNSLSGKIVDVQREELDKSVENGLKENVPLSNHPLQRIIFGAPGTGKSHLLSDDAQEFEKDNVIRFKPEKRKEKFLQKLEKDGKEKYVQYLNEHLDFSDDLFSRNNREEIKRIFEVKKKDDPKNEDYWIVKRYLEYASEEPMFIQHCERVTFHPNYSYAQFVGTYKPVQDDEDEKQIKYEYVPGPFMRTYRRAVKYPKQKFLLIIEEINRANVAAVFGDIFQLLDRKNGVSEYPIAASEDVRNFLADNGINEKELSIPDNMYIWATMNSADQGVFPMDTAFKRRWEFEYIGIDDNADKVAEYEIPIGKQGDNAKWKVKWDVLRRAINDKLISLGINEDKLLGPFFLSKSILENALADGMTFVKSFESKVLMYLFEDAARMKVRQLFKISSEKYIYSEVCREFEEKGIGIFDFKQTIEVTDITPSEG